MRRRLRGCVGKDVISKSHDLPVAKGGRSYAEFDKIAERTSDPNCRILGGSLNKTLKVIQLAVK